MSASQTPFRLHRTYSYFKPGRSKVQFETLPHVSIVKNTGDGLFFFIVALFFLLFAALIIAAVIYHLAEDLAYVNNGQNITAYMVNCEVEKSKYGSLRVIVAYRYEVGAKSYTDEGRVDGETCTAYPAETPLTVRYLSFDPAQSRIGADAGGASMVEAIFVSIVMTLPSLAFGAIGVFFLYDVLAYLRAKRMHPRLSASTTLLTGTIVSIKGARQGKHELHYYVDVHYEFESPAAKILKGKASAERQDLMLKPLPAVGTPVSILYADDSTYMIL